MQTWPCPCCTDGYNYYACLKHPRGHCPCGPEAVPCDVCHETGLEPCNNCGEHPAEFVRSDGEHICANCQRREEE